MVKLPIRGAPTVRFSIDSNGVLFIARRGVLERQYCPHQSDTLCNHGCPQFDDEHLNHASESPHLKLWCTGRVILGPWVDQRRSVAVAGD